MAVAIVNARLGLAQFAFEPGEALADSLLTSAMSVAVLVAELDRAVLTRVTGITCALGVFATVTMMAAQIRALSLVTCKTNKPWQALAVAVLARPIFASKNTILFGTVLRSPAGLASAGARNRVASSLPAAIIWAYFCGAICAPITGQAHANAVGAGTRHAPPKACLLGTAVTLVPKITATDSIKTRSPTGTIISALLFRTVFHRKTVVANASSGGAIAHTMARAFVGARQTRAIISDKALETVALALVTTAILAAVVWTADVTAVLAKVPRTAVALARNLVAVTVRRAVSQTAAELTTFPVIHREAPTKS